MLDLILDICNTEFVFDDYEKCRDYFKDMINIIRQMNYSEFNGEAFEDYNRQLTKLIKENVK